MTSMTRQLAQVLHIYQGLLHIGS